MSNTTKGDEMMAHCGFYLSEVEDSPIPEVNPDGKTYIYKREQCDDIVVIDALQCGIKINSDWYSLSDFEAIVAKAKELGLLS